MLQTAQPDLNAPLPDRLRSGDERAFVILVERYRPSMRRLMAGYVPNHAIAEEVVHDAWLGHLRGLSRFEERSSVRTWLLCILINRAWTAGIRSEANQRVLLVPRAEPAPPASRVRVREGMMPLRLSDRPGLVRQEAVELVTDYLEGALSRSAARTPATGARPSSRSPPSPTPPWPGSASTTKVSPTTCSVTSPRMTSPAARR